MIQLNKEKCTACGACAQICPAKSISMRTDSDGFLFPDIDAEKCISCSECNRACQLETQPPKKSDNQTAFAAVCTDTRALAEATSGGAFGALAEQIIAQGGSVYGCAWQDGLRAAHIRVTDKYGLSRLKGSKYVQSNTEQTLCEAKNDLDNGLQVLYSGTPCQIAGLNSFLGRYYENLLTVDIICHGVPSQAYLDKFIEWFERKNGVTVIDLSFRSKKNSGWSCAGMYMAKKADGKIIEKKLNYFNNYYYFYFLNSDIYRENCYLCKWSNLNRPGDITLGDLWGAEGLKLTFSVTDGCSLVIVNTKRGKKALEKSGLKICEIPVGTAVNYNTQLEKPSVRSPQREELLRRYREYDGAKIQKMFKQEKRRAIIYGKLKYSIPVPLKNILQKLRYMNRKEG